MIARHKIAGALGIKGLEFAKHGRYVSILRITRVVALIRTLQLAVS